MSAALRWFFRRRRRTPGSNGAVLRVTTNGAYRVTTDGAYRVLATGETSLPHVASATLLHEIQADALVLNDGDPVSTFGMFTQSGSARPTYVANDGGYPAVRFSQGSEQWMLGPDFQTPARFAILVVASFNGVGGGFYPVLGNAADFESIYYAAYPDATLLDGGFGMTITEYGVADALAATNHHALYVRNNDTPYNQYVVLTAEQIDTATHFAVNGSRASEDHGSGNQNSPPVTNFGTAKPLRLGHIPDPTGFNGNTYIPMKLRTVLVYRINDTAAWDATDRAASEGYLISKYGITL